MENKITLYGRIVATFIGFILFLGLGELGLRIAKPNWDEFSPRFINRVPGYRNFLIGVPGFDGYFSQNNGDFRAHIQINQAGLRNDEPVQSASGRIWVVGDSMAFGWGVERSETYTARLEHYAGQPTYNIASPGADICGYQKLLARMPEGIIPKAIVLGVILENDIGDYNCQLREERLKDEKLANNKTLEYWLSMGKEWLTTNSAMYNFLAVSLKRVESINRILIKMGLLEKEHRYRRSINDVDVNRYVAKTVSEIVYIRKMYPPDVPLVTLIAPARFEIRDDDPFYHNLRISVLTELKKYGIPYLDIFAPLKKAGFSPTHFAHDGHWSPLGHDIAGKALSKWFKAHSPKK